MQQTCFSLQFGIILADQLATECWNFHLKNFLINTRNSKAYFQICSLQYWDLSLGRQGVCSVFSYWFLHFSLSKIWSICALWMPSGCGYFQVYKSTILRFMWLMMESRSKFAVLTQPNKSFGVIVGALVIWVSANNFWERIIRNFSNTCIEIPKDNNKVMNWYWRNDSM